MAISLSGALGSIVWAARSSRTVALDLKLFRFAVSGTATTTALVTLLSVMAARAIVAPDSVAIPAVLGAFMTTLVILALVLRSGVRCLGVIRAAGLATST